MGMCRIFHSLFNRSLTLAGSYLMFTGYKPSLQSLNRIYNMSILAAIRKDEKERENTEAMGINLMYPACYFSKNSVMFEELRA